jgi:hypothetical protein
MRFASYYLLLGLAVCASLALTGCPTVRMPQLYHPGSAGYQRANALQFDPYPLDDVAPPVAGGRPREYDRPVPEVKRGQAYTPKRPKLRPIAIPSFAPSAAPVFTAPPALPGSPVSPFAPPANVPYQTPPPALPPASSMVRPPY